MTQPACQVFAKFYKAMIAQCTFHSQPPADVIIPDIRWKSWKPECALSFNMGISILSRARENNWPVASQWQTLSHNVGLSKPHHEQDLNSQPQWWWARIAQVVVTPTTIRSRLRPPILIYFLFSTKYFRKTEVWTLHIYLHYLSYLLPTQGMFYTIYILTGGIMFTFPTPYP